MVSPRVIWVAVSFFVLALVSQAQNGPPAHPPKPTLLGPAQWEPAARQVSAAYWTLEPGWSTTLEMRNNLTAHELTITPVLRMPSGQEISLRPVTVPPQHIVAVDLRAPGEVDAGIVDHSDSFGSVAFRFDALNAGNLFAATIVRREGRPIDFHFDADQAGPNYSTGGIEGMWWLPAASSTDYLILSNPSPKPVSAALLLSGISSSLRIPLRIGPGETNRIDLRQVLGPSANGAVGGLTVALPGKESLSATQIVFDEITGVTAIMKLFEREPDDKATDHVLLAPMMALSQADAGLGFPSGTTLIPRVFLRNAGQSAAQVSIGLSWRSGSKSGNFSVPIVNLPTGDVKIVSLADYRGPGQIPADANWGTLKISYSGRRADVVAVALSYDQDNRYGLQTPFSEALSRLWAGGMWHVDPTHNTLITTGNGGSEGTTAEVTLFYNEGKDRYRTQKLLSPGQQLWLDVGQLIRDQVPDSDGRIISPNTMNGSYELRDLDHPTVGQLYEGKLVIDKTYGHASYGCGTCCGYGVPKLVPSPFGGPPGINNTDQLLSLEQCTGNWVDLADDAYGWQSSNTAVATLPSKVLHTVAVGSATGSSYVYVQADKPAPACPMATYGAQQPVTVASVSCSPASVTRGGTTTCTATGPSGSTFGNWKFSDGTNSVTNSSTSNKWSGAVVKSGTVSVTVTSSSGSATPSASITVNNRSNFTFTAVNPTQLSANSITCYDGTNIILPSPPAPNSQEGYSCADLAYSFNYATVNDNGPNNGYEYVTSASAVNGSQPTQFQFIVVSDLLSGTPFYNHQCGNYSSSNLSGFIANSQLKQNVFDHESGSVFSHWTEYRDAQNNSSNNIGTVLESTTAPPGSTGNSFAQSAGDAALQRIKQAVNNEPCGGIVNADSAQSCAQCGTINFQPYQSCTGQPVPYCH